MREGGTFHPLDYLALVAYLVALVWMGFYFARRGRTTEDFFLAGRRIPWWAATLSIFCTYLSGVTFMGIPHKAFEEDWSSIVFNVAIIMVAPITVFCFLPFYSRLRVTTIYEYLEKRFSPGLRVYGSLTFMVFQLGKMGVFLLLPALALAEVTDFSVHACIVVMGVLCIVYTVLGGIEAVVWTDVLQSLVLVGGGLLCIGVVFSAESFDFAYMKSVAVDGEANKFFIGDLADSGFWKVLLGACCIQLVAFTSDQAVAQRFLSTPDLKSSARSVWAHAAMVAPASLLFFGLGTVLYVFYASRPEALPTSGQADIIVPWFVATQLPAGFAGLVIAGLFAATMSSVDSGMHSIATTLVNDVYAKARPNATDATRLRVARTIMVVVGLGAVLSALFVTSLDPKSLWIFILRVVALFGSTLSGVFLLGVLTRRANASGTAVGIVASLVTLLVLWNSLEKPFPTVLATAGVFTCFGVGYVASLLLPGDARSLANLTLRTLDGPKPR